jgi:RNA polymerase sigma-70 factor (ECF subfamily)
MRDVRGGRTAALATLFERHHARLYRYCLRMTGNRAVAEDLVQDVFMNDRLTDSDVDGTAQTDDAAELSQHDGQDELVRRALQQLPAAGREVLVLSRYEYKTYDEIAKTLECSVGAVKVRAHRAMKQLREIYLDMAGEREVST